MLTKTYPLNLTAQQYVSLRVALTGAIDRHRENAAQSATAEDPRIAGMASYFAGEAENLAAVLDSLGEIR
jgi:hypothetical protein